MTPSFSDALDVSRRTSPDADGLPRLLLAEEAIARVADVPWATLQRQLASTPADGFLWLWNGLVLEHRGQFDSACNHYAEAIEHGCSHWRVGWYIARAAKALGNLDLVDSACAAVLKANPEFWFARELPKHARGYYSQLGQDKRIEAFFKDNPPRTRRFVEVGAFDGVHYSNVRRMQEHHGWSGLCIEPVPKNFAKLASSYSGADVRCVQAAVSTQDGQLDIHVSHYPHLPDWGSDVASLGGADQERWTKRYGAQWTVEKVPARRLSRLLDEAGIDDFDLLSIDAEGHDLEVLQSLDLERFQPQLIVVEYGSKRDAILSFFAQHGYSMLLDNKQDLFAARITHGMPSTSGLPATRNFAGATGRPGYEEIQCSVERGLHEWIRRPAAEVERIVIVGGYVGTEVRTFLDQYTKAEIVIFEPSKRYFPRLQAAYASEARVKCLPLAVGDSPGSSVFHEGSLNGVGSLLPLKTRADDQTWIPKTLTPAESYPVEVVTLDTLSQLADRPIDLLWCDVQGAELLVLKGAIETLRRCRCLFLEVATSLVTYDGQCRLADLKAFLADHGFYLAGVGLCPSGNGTGNSVWLRLPEACHPETVSSTSSGLVIAPNVARPWTELVNPHLLEIDYLPRTPAPSQQNLDPISLFQAERFDFGAKVLYARHRLLGVESIWASRVYEEHIRAFSRGTFSEGDGLKTSIQTYRDAFHSVLDSVREKGLDPAVSLVPVDRNHVPIDGSHRVAAALAFGSQVPSLVFDLQANSYDGSFFRDRGLPEPMLDALALEFARLQPEARLVFLFPCAAGHLDEVRSILEHTGSIAYEKSLHLQRQGPALFVRELYDKEPWTGSWSDGFAGAAKAALTRFRGSEPLRVFLFVPTTPSATRSAKERIRQLYGLGNEACHINDTPEETVRLAQLLFNDQSRHFLNHAQPRYLERFEKHLDRYRDWLRKSGRDADHFCVDGSATMAAYGIRDAQDLDVLHLDDVDFSPVMPEVNSHNAHAHHHTVRREQILFHPDHHFYYRGLKFVALHTLRAMKARRAEGKDLIDVAAMDRLSDPSRSSSTPTTPSRGSASPIPAPAPAQSPSTSNVTSQPAQGRIIGLVPARNEAARLPFCLRALACYTDAIVYLDDCSDDDSVRVVESLAAECRVERILTKSNWNRDEPGDRNALLNAGRQIGGTHFIVLDADEAFTANCRADDSFRHEILNLQPGDRMVLTWIQLWRGLDQYRFDQSVWTNNRKAFAFADDGACSYSSEFIHTPRVPANLKGRSVTVPGYERGVLHFQFVHWPNLQIKQSWYRCMERVRHPERPASQINTRYAPSEDESNLKTQAAPAAWFEGYPFLDPEAFRVPDERRIREVLQWFAAHGRQHFADLDIWRVDWDAQCQLVSSPSVPNALPSLKSAKPVTPPPPPTVPKRHKPGSACDECLRFADRFFQEGKLADARQWLERVLDLEPSSPEVWLAVGNLSLQLDDIPTAVQALTRATELRPKHAPSHAALAAACIRADRIEDFEKSLSVAFAIDPSEPSAIRLLADLNLRNNRFLDAAQGYYQLVQRTPNDIPSLLALGFCFAKAGDNASAQSVFTEILRYDPSHEIARENLVAVGGAPTLSRDSRPARSAEGSRELSTTLPPLVTAIVSTYKSERFIRGCLQDLLNQTIADRLEIIVIDSGSPENERAIVEEFQTRHPRIRYVRTERESIYSAWNRGVQLASAPYLTSANADDRHRPEALERLVSALEANPACSLAYADCAVCENVHPDFGYTELRGYFRWPDFDPVLLFRGCYVGPQPVWRRTLHDRYGLFDASYRSAGDYEFWLRLAKTERFLHLPEVLGLHWYAESSLGHENRDLTRAESDRARTQHWPGEWGKRPTETFRTLYAIPSVEKLRQRNAELTGKIEGLEREIKGLEAGPTRRASPASNPASSPSLTPAPLPSSGPASVSPMSLLPSDSNPEAFQRLLQGFDLLREGRFEEAQASCMKYREAVNYDALSRVDHRSGLTPAVSVVIVAHQTRQALIRCLESLAVSPNPPHEIIVVDNGGNESIETELHRLPILHVRTPVNVLPSEARNIGVHFALAPIVAFVDDDATVAEGYLASILAGFEAFEIVALRGKVLPRTDHVNNRSVRHYDLGDIPLTADINTEGNSAFRVDAWRRLGGQDSLLFGGEGVELSFRITARFGPSAILYWPSSVIFHDYAEDDSKLSRKNARHNAARAYLEWKHSGVQNYHDQLKQAPVTPDERLQRTQPLRSRGNTSPPSDSQPKVSPVSQPTSVVVESPIAALRSALARHGWMTKFDSYAAKLKSLEHTRSVPDPQLSVVIIAHEIRVDSIKVLQKLHEERDGRFEVVYVLNGSRTIDADQVRPYVDTLVVLTENTGAYFARNVGAAFAKAPILFFLDDDAIPATGCVAAHLEEFRQFDVIAVRGAIRPKTQNPLNDLAKHYFLGNRRFPVHADVEGNTSYLARTFFAVGGWDDEIIFGGGGIDLAFRLLRVESDRRKQIYSPVPVVFHDYAANPEHLARKHKKQAESRERLLRKHPQFETLRNGWLSFFGKDKLIIPKATGDAASSPPAVSNGTQVPGIPDVTDKNGFRPLITIAIPTYNRARYLAEAVQSALHQTYTHLEVVIVDDGSTDRTESVLQGFNDPRIRCFTKKHSGGPATRNRCIAEARGDFIVWLDSDDFLLADTLELYVAELQRNPGLEVLYGNLLVGDEGLRVQEVWTYNDYQGWSEALLAETAIENRIPNVGTLVRKTCYERFGGYDEAFPRAHDYEFWTRLASNVVVKSIHTEVAIYRRHEDSLTKLTKPADTRYEANAVKGLLARHSLRELFPFCYPAGGPVLHGDARALSLVSLLMAKYGDVPSAISYARKSVESGEVDNNVEILRILEALSGRFKSSSHSKSASPDEFRSLVETGKRQFAAGQVQPCAKACARLSEIRPEAPETMLLTAMSLRRWGASQDATTAFHYLVRRQCRASYTLATEEAEALRVAGSLPADASHPPSRESTARGLLARRLAPLIASFFAPEPIPPAGVEVTLDYLEKAVAAPDLSAFLATHLRGQSPVFFALLGLTAGELAGIADPSLTLSISRVRSALATPSTHSSRRKPGYSFCIITGGSRPEKVARQIATIRALGFENFEILVGGDVSEVSDDVRKVDLASFAKAGQLGRMRNALGRLAEFDHLVISDDDIVFDPGFADGLKRFGEGYQFMAVRIRNPDGTRFWDWSTTGGLRGSVLLDYWESDPNTYVTGGFCVLKAEVLDRIKWDDLRGFYQHEDVDFSTRAKAAGFPVRYNPFCTVVHDDDRYSRVGREIFRFDHLLGEVLQNHLTRDRREIVRLLAAAQRIAGTYPDRLAALQETVTLTGIALPPPCSAPTPSGAGSAGPAKPASVPTSSAPRPIVDWIGSFLDHGSLSHVNREFTRAFQALPGVEVRCVASSTRPAAKSSPGWKVEAARLASSSSSNASVTVRHAWPPQWDRPRNGALVVIQPWEFGSLPRKWVQDLEQVDEVWIPSEYVRRVFVDSGVPEQKVVVVPNGIDPARFHPEVPRVSLATRKRFKFLFVGGTIFRKGPDLLLEAYLSRFTAADDVCLVIKDFGGQTAYAGQTFEQSIRAAQALPNAAEILYINEEWSPEKIPGLYTACDCLVHPYRGEGFGLPVLEAMASGLPVVVTAGGATDDFATDEFAFRISATRKPIGASVSGMPLVQSGWVLEPCMDVLADRLRWIFDHPDEARARGQAASQHVREHWTWAHSARIALARVLDLGTRPQVPQKEKAHRRPAPLQLPKCALAGHLGSARDLLQKKKPREAWVAALEALRQRPFHPEAYLFLAEVARSVGDSVSARLCAQHARSLVPDWKPARQFLKAAPRGNQHPAWLQLPQILAPSESDAPPKSRLSVCLIVKDEERFLGQCLRSIAPVADQMVVVDTGSTDRTVEIAREFGAEVHSFTWCDDFSAARNAALVHARGDWILMLDADEELPPEQHARLLEDLRKVKVLGFRLPLVNVGAEAEGLAFVPRLYRNAPGLFYISRIHEQVFSSILVRAEEWGLDTALGTAQLQHHGYSKELIRDRRKVERNLTLLHQAVAEFPDDANLLMNLGLERIHSGELEAGLAQYESAFQALSCHPEQLRAPELRETLLTQHASALMQAGRFPDIIRILQSPLARAHPLTASLHFALGLAFLRTDRPEAAAPEMKECLAKRHLQTVSPVNPEIRLAGPYHCLGLCFSSAGQYGEAEAAFIAALRDEASSRPVRMDLARLYRTLKRPVDALKVLHELIDSRRADTEVWRLGAEIALSHPSLLPFALDWTGEAVKHLPDQAILAGQHGEALLLSGDPNAAIPHFRRSSTDDDPSHRAALCLCEAACGISLSPVTANDEAAVATHFIRWFQRLSNSPHGSLLLKVVEQLTPLERVLPSAARLLRAALAEAA